MKVCIFFTLFFLSATLFTQAQVKQQTVTSKIENVSVYTNGAQINRSAKTQLNTGNTELVFTGLSPQIDPQSIQLSGSGSFTILSVNFQKNYLNANKPTAEVTDLKTQKNALQQKIKVEKNSLLVLQKEQTILEKNQAVGGENVGVKAVDLKDVLDLQRSRLTEIYSKQLEVENRLASLDSVLNKINLQLRELNAQSNKGSGNVVVTVSSKAPTSAVFNLNYYVSNAGWTPFYDVRVKDVVSPINTTMKANVYQSCGEDWDNVKLTLSTGNPLENTITPELVPWYLSFGYAARQNNLYPNYLGSKKEVSGIVIDASTGSPIAGVSVFSKASNVGTSTSTDGTFRLKINNPNTDYITIAGVGYESIDIPTTSSNYTVKLKTLVNDLSSVVVTALSRTDDNDGSDYGYHVNNDKEKGKISKKNEVPLVIAESTQQTTISYEIETPYTILSDGKNYAVSIKEFDMPATYEYYTAPKIDAVAYLTAQVKNWQDYNLLSAEANLYVDGAYVGKTVLKTTNAGDTLNLSLGTDKGISVERKLEKDYSSKKIVGTNKTDTRAYQIIIRNNKKQPIAIVVKDQFPISTQSNINVFDEKQEGGVVDENTKIITWRYTITPKQEQKIQFSYSVKYPKNETVIAD